MQPIAYEDGDISLLRIQEAQKRLAGYAVFTPIFTSSTLSAIAGCELHFKCEVFQKTGSFKFRGAFNAISKLPEAISGVVTHSSGNHAAAVALAARMKAIPAHIVVPWDTPKIKQAAVIAYGGKLVLCEPTIEAREATCNSVHESTGAVFIPPYNHADVICGQGTIALEFLNQVDGLDALIVPVSGGGMLSGIAVAAKSLTPSIKIIAAEPTGTNGAADVAASKKANVLVHLPKPNTICDGLQARLGSITWPIVRDLVDDVIEVSEEQVVEAMRLCYERLKVVVEPSGAAGLAAALQLRNCRYPADLRRVGVILCGGNVDFEGRMPGFWGAWAS